MTSLADRETVRHWSLQAAPGSVIVLVAGRPALAEARHAYSSMENVMASPGDRNDIPWRDSQFMVILDESADNPTPEMLRVLAPEGRILAL
jgi:hypothetical protein